jgi:hypothetical protein
MMCLSLKKHQTIPVNLITKLLSRLKQGVNKGLTRPKQGKYLVWALFVPGLYQVYPMCYIMRLQTANILFKILNSNS